MWGESRGCVSHIQTQEQKNLYVQKKAISIILDKGPINRYKLAVLMGMTPRSYQNFHQFMVEAYDHVVIYNPETKIWKKKLLHLETDGQHKANESMSDL